MGRALIGNFKGPKGDKGDKGDTGAQGSAGAQGKTGATGAPGPTGQRGSRWTQGTAITGTSTTATVFSSTGITDALVNDSYLNTSNGNTYRCTVAGAASVAKWVYTGNIRGATGPTGPQGNTGAAGATGPKGDKGDKGDTGPAGPTGPKGNTGAAGAAGPTGQRGSRWTQGTAITGTSTTATAFSGSGITDALVNDNYINTSTGNTYRCTVAGNAATAKWVYTGCLKGPKGDTGAKGAQGTTGATGPTGPTGATGPKGATGATGQRGSKWYSGTVITGTSTTATVFSGSGITGALVDDQYLNPSTGNTYRCTVSGAASVAKWVYAGNIKGPAAAVDSTLSATSTNTVQNKVIKSALDGKLSTSGGTVKGTIKLDNGLSGPVDKLVTDISPGEISTVTASGNGLVKTNELQAASVYPLNYDKGGSLSFEGPTEFIAGAKFWDTAEFKSRLDCNVQALNESIKIEYDGLRTDIYADGIETGFLHGETSESTVKFANNDASNPTAWTNVATLTSGEEHKSIFGKVATMFKNVRYLNKMLGTTDISKIGNGTVTGAISQLNGNLTGNKYTVEVTNYSLVNLTAQSLIVKGDRVLLTLTGTCLFESAASNHVTAMRLPANIAPPTDIGCSIRAWYTNGASIVPAAVFVKTSGTIGLQTGEIHNIVFNVSCSWDF